MPLYDLQCKTCGHEEEHFLKLEEFNLFIPCSQCGGKMEHEITTCIPFCLPDKIRRWGTSLYRKEGDKVRPPRHPQHTPLLLKGDPK